MGPVVPRPVPPPANGSAPAAGAGTGLRAPAAGGVKHPPAEPPRVCWGRIEAVNSPVSNYTAPAPACGKTQRTNLDAVTFDRELVTCRDCLAALAAGPGGGGPGLPQPAPPPPGAAGKAAWRQALEGLDEGTLRARLAELEGEIEAVKVFLRAAQARDRRAKKKAGDGGAA
jgi:hypothetical protein